MKQADKAMRDADKKLTQECRRQVLTVYGAAGIALHDKWRFGQDKVIDVFDKTESVWHEVGGDNRTSMLSMLEDETGIEVRLTNSSKSWHDISYLNGTIPASETITKAQYIYMRLGQRAWMGAMVQACLYLALYRYFGFGTTKLRHLMEEIDRIRAENNNKEKVVTEKCRQATGINVVRYYTEKRSENVDSNERTTA